MEKNQKLQMSSQTSSYKTKMCINPQSCRFGKYCKFAHNEEEMNKNRSRTPSPKKIEDLKRTSPIPDNYKTSLCVNFEKGTCNYGKQCHFAHGKKELKKISSPLKNSLPLSPPKISSKISSEFVMDLDNFPNLPQSSKLIVPIKKILNIEEIPINAQESLKLREEELKKLEPEPNIEQEMNDNGIDIQYKNLYEDLKTKGRSIAYIKLAIQSEKFKGKNWYDDE